MHNIGLFAGIFCLVVGAVTSGWMATLNIGLGALNLLLWGAHVARR